MTLTMRHTRLAAPLMLALVVTTPSLLAAPRENSMPSRASLLSRQRSATSHSRQVQSKLRGVKRQQAAVRVDLHRVEQRVRESRTQLQVATRAYSDSKQQLAQATASLRRAEARLEAQKRDLSSRLRFIHEHGDIGYVSVLTGAVSFSDFADRYYYLGEIVAQDADLLRGLKRTRQAVAERREQVAEKTAEVGQWKADVARKHENYNAARVEKQRTLAELARMREEYEAEYAEAEAERREIESLLRALARTRAGRKRYATPWTGTFANPVPGARITSGYGWRTHPILHVRKFHHGVDLAAPSGSPIYAAGSGEVILSRYGGNGYGRYIVIDHGGGVTTLYGHCSSLLVKVGDRVGKGTLIARVGSTGLSTGPHCHFEVRHGGSTVPPM